MEIRTEPLTGTPLGALGTVQALHNKVKTPRASVALIQDVYSNETCQRHVYELLRRLQDIGGIEGVLVEGFDGPIDAESALREGADLRERMDRRSQVSAGVLEFAAWAGARVPIHGIEDLVLRDRHHAAVRTCLEGRPYWTPVVGAFQTALATAQDRVGFTDAMRRAAAMATSPELKHVAALASDARAAGLEVDRFDAIVRYLDLLAREQTMDFAAIERDRSKLVRSVVDALTVSWRRSRGLAGADPQRVAAMVRLWLRLSQRQARDAIRRADGPESLLDTCQQSIIRLVVSRAMDTRGKQMSQASFYNQILSIALAMGVDIDDFRAFLAYRDYLESSELVAPNVLLWEMQDLAHQLLGPVLITQPQREVRAAAGHLQRLARAGTQELTWTDANLLDDRIDWTAIRRVLRPYVFEVDRIQVSTEAVEVTRAAIAYAQIAVRRGEVMAARVVRLLGERRWRRVALVCGGFHTDAICNELRDLHDDIAWSVIKPDFSL